MNKANFKTFVLLLLYILVHGSAVHAQIPPNTLYFQDGKEVDITLVRKVDPLTIENLEIVKSEDAAKLYGIKGRFGVIRFNSGRNPVSFPKGNYGLTLYSYNDSSKNLRQQRYFHNDLKELLRVTVNENPNADLAIDDLINYNAPELSRSLQLVSGVFNSIYARYAVDSVSISKAELIFYSYKIYRSGKFYFSGRNFGNVISCNAYDMNCIRNNIKNCIPGTVITLVDCVPRNTNLANEVINKLIKLD